MEYSSYAARWDRVVFRGDPPEGKFIAFWIAGGVVVAAMNANVWDVAGPIQRLIDKMIAVHAAELSDVDTPLEALINVEL